MIKNFLKYFYTSSTFYKFINFAAKPWKGHGAIIMYHRVLPVDKINQDYDLGLAVTLSNFENQIKFLKNNYTLVSMDDFIEKLKNRKKNEFYVTVTFDDGYKDNLDYALPVLKKNNIPATLYITTRFLEKYVWLWWYELKEIINVNKSLNFEYKNKKHFYSMHNKKQKNKTFYILRKLFLNQSINEQLNLLEIISQSKERKNYSKIFLNANDLKFLNKEPLISLGSHTHNHPNLKNLKKEEKIFDIEKANQILEKLLNKKIKHFAYPYGGKNEASKNEYEVAQNLKLNSAVTTRTYPANYKRLFSLPRIYVGKNANEKVIRSHLTGFYNFISKFI